MKEANLKNSAKGKFIVIDGSDGSGKKTQSDILIAKLKSDGHEVASYDFPQYDKTFFGALVGRYLNGEFGKMEEISPYLVSLLYAGDRWQASEGIKKDLAAGKIVVSNRYMQSNMAYSAARFSDEKERKEFLDWLEKLEFETYSIPKPDLVVFLYVPYKIGVELVAQKPKRNYTNKSHDLHENNSLYMQEVEKEYLRLSKEYLEWRKIECTSRDKIMPIETISAQIFDIVKKEVL